MPGKSHSEEVWLVSWLYKPLWMRENKKTIRHLISLYFYVCEYRAGPVCVWSGMEGGSAVFSVWQFELNDPYKKQCIKRIRKTAVLLCTFIRPCPPSSFDKYNTLWDTQCNFSQKKSIKTLWISDSSDTGGSTQSRRCHKEEATRLLIIKVCPLYDIFGINHFHLFNLPFTLSRTSSQFFLTINLIEKFYILLFVCVCVCVCEREREREREDR